MNKLKILFGTLLVMASLLFVAYPIDTLPHPVCMANLKAPLQATAGQSVTFDASSSFCYVSGTSIRVPVSNYAFNFGDGNAISGPSPAVSHAYFAAGSYSPSVTVNAQGWQSTSSWRISIIQTLPTDPSMYLPQTSITSNPTPLSPTYINVPPIITAFNANPRFGDEPLTVVFNGSAFDSNGDPMTYVLFFDWNGNTAKNTTGTIGPAIKILGNYTYSAGNWQAKMDVSDGKNKSSRTITFHVNFTNNSPISYPDTNVTTTMCYQESANVSTACGGLATGKYFASPDVTEAIDGDWNTYNTDNNVWINYTKPANALGAIWQIKSDAAMNLTIPAACWNAYSDTLVLAALGSAFPAQPGASYWCNNGANGWSGDVSDGTWIHLWTENEITNIYTHNVYEEAIWWNGSGPAQPQLPVACMTASDNGGYLPLTLTFNGSCSYDLDSAILYHTWRIEKENGPAIIEVQGNNSPGIWQYTFTEQGKYFIYLKVADEQYQAVETNVTIRAEQYLLGPVIGWFRGEPSSGYAPLTVSFKSSAIGIYPLTYTLFFSIDDRTKNVTGVINSTDSVLGNFLYISGGTFGKTHTIELVVSDPLNHTISKRASVHVSPVWTNPNNSQNTCPMINFTYSPSDVYVGDEVQFTDQSTDQNGQIIYWIWQFGDGAGSGDSLVSGEQNPKHAYSSAGNHTASLIVYDNSGCMNLTRQAIEVKEKVVPPQPQPSGGWSGGGSGLYLGPPTPVIIQTSGIGYLDFHPSYALNGTRTYSFDNKTNTTTLTLRIVNLAKFARNFTIRDVIPKDLAASMQEVQIIPVPMTVFNQDPDIGWNFTLASKQAFEAKYVFKKYIPFSKFESLPRPVITEFVKSEAIPVSPERQVTVAGGVTAFVISAFSNPWIGAIVLVVILVFFFAFTETGRGGVNSAATRTRDFVTSIMNDLEEPKEEENKSERVRKLKKLMKKKRK